MCIMNLQEREQGTPHHPDFFELYSQHILKTSLSNEYTWEMLYAFSLCKHIYTVSNLIAATQKLLSWTGEMGKHVDNM